MKITIEEVEKMASLSMFYVTDEDKEMLRSNLEAIINHVKKLDELDTQGVEPTTYILKQRNVFRQDEPAPRRNQEELLRNAPEQDDGCFIVPKVVE